MEKQIRVVARYRLDQGYYVEVSNEDSVIANRDYWLCRQDSPKKLYMFSGPRTDEVTEEHRILAEISAAIKAFEAADTTVRYA